MSHFTVLIIGPDVEKQLQPFHEYECTGIEDEYVIDVNKNDDVKEFLDSEVFYGLKLNGDLDYHYGEDQAKEHLTEFKKGTKLEYFQAKGLTPEEIDDEIVDYHGYNKVGDDWFRKTNPNAQWDWWVVGGRWTGFFKLKEGKDGELGTKSLMMMGHKVDEETADVVRKGDVDFDYMRDKAEVRAIKEIDIVLEAIKGTPEPLSWDQVREKFSNKIDESRNYYNSQPRIVAFNNVTKKNSDIFGWMASYEDYNFTREEYIKNERNRAITTYAIVKDSQWYSKGKMGWWGMSNDNFSQNEWNEKFNQMIDELPDDTILTLIDAHI